MLEAIDIFMDSVSKEEVDNVKKILERHKDEIKKYEIQGTGVGFKTKNGEITNKLAIIIYVKKKKNIDELNKEKTSMIPKEIEGIPTDIVEVPEGFKPR
jgi:hypothetical protein